MKSPAFQFYAADFLIGCMGMADEEVGIYIKMLAFQWERGSLPNCAKTIKKIIGSRKVPSEVVLQKFEIGDDNLLRNPRLEIERQKQVSFRESRSQNAQRRWNKPCTSNARALSSISENDALHTSSSNIPPNPQGGNRRESKVPQSEEAKRIAKMFNRRLTTGWSKNEIKVFKELSPIDPDDLDAVEAYYEREKNNPESRLRHDLSTFLNNFRSEVDRANRTAPQQQANGYKLPNIG